MATITDNDLTLFRERAKTELKSIGDVGRLAWADVVEALCKEVARLRSVSKGLSNAAKLREALTTIQKLIKLHGDNEPQFALTLISEVVYAALAAPARICDVLGEEAMVNVAKSAIATHVAMATDHERKIAEVAATAALATAYAAAPMKESEVAK